MEVNRVNSTASLAAAMPSQGETKLQATPELAQAVQAVNGAKLFGHDSELTFVLDRETRRTVVQLVDRDTRKLIRQIPAEYVLRLAQDAESKRLAEVQL
jgi:uncharacterized FlaG/YvyC family protein